MGRKELNQANKQTGIMHVTSHFGVSFLQELDIRI